MSTNKKIKEPILASDYSPKVAQEIEEKWRRHWLETKTFATQDPTPDSKTFYCLDMFPYPSGNGLHVGHPVGYIASDIVSRYKRMRGFEVLHPMGWDAFGLPAERHAMKTGVHPSVTTEKNADNYKRQMDLIGLSFDWDRKLSTTDPSYYKWTQFIFVRLFNAWFDHDTQKARPISELPIPQEVAAQSESAVSRYRDEHRLVHLDDAIVNFCPQLGCVVANEEVMADGRTEHGYDVVRLRQRQVMMRISAYAERLLAGLDELDWSPAIKEQQRTWIGRSSGMEIDFRVATDVGQETLTVFTTCPETLFGVTFLAIAPEHPLLEKLATDAHRPSATEYAEQAIQRGELARKQQTDKTGVFTGRYAKNPISGQDVPIYVADYVLMERGTGALMAVPAHDQRDFDFAKIYSVPIHVVFKPDDANEAPKVLANEIAWMGSGYAIEQDNDVFTSLGLLGLDRPQVASKVSTWLQEHQLGRPVVHYRIRDWVFARQRYWGEPIPLIHWEDGTTTSIPEEELPLELPMLENINVDDSGEPPLARAVDWVHVVDPVTGKKGRRELSTMPQWAGSCWYPLRFMDPHNSNALVAPEKEARWGAVDLYIGGAEHATLHLLYARFWYLAMHDLGLIQTKEPFKKLVNQGLLGAFAYKTPRGVVIPVDDVEEREEGKFYLASSSEHYIPGKGDIEVQKVRAKMSKSLRNVVNPDDVISEYGADSFRVYLMFMGPVEQPREWETKNVVSASRFLRRFWKFVTGGNETGIRNTIPETAESIEVKKAVHDTIRIVTESLEGLKLNAPISQFMICMNNVGQRDISKSSLDKLVRCLSPFAPFLSDELGQRLGYKDSLARVDWPDYDPAILAHTEKVEVTITVKGKKRSSVETEPEIDDERLRALVREELDGTNWAVSEQAKMIIVRAKDSGHPKLVNII